MRGDKKARRGCSSTLTSQRQRLVLAEFRQRGKSSEETGPDDTVPGFDFEMGWYI